MSISEDIKSEISTILDQSWNDRKGNVVPSVDSVALKGGLVNLSATMLYADLADSTELAVWNSRIAAKIFKSFLSGSGLLIKHCGGAIRSFDGDRIMGVFLGDAKNTSAVSCALHINWMTTNILNPQLQQRYEHFRDGRKSIKHCCGIDCSEVSVVRAGVHIDNDLVWVGRSPNIAAKLSTLRNHPYNTYITKNVHGSMSKTVKVSNTGKDMWEPRSWGALPIADKDLFRSSWWRSP